MRVFQVLPGTYLQVHVATRNKNKNKNSKNKIHIILYYNKQKWNQKLAHIKIENNLNICVCMYTRTHTLWYAYYVDGSVILILLLQACCYVLLSKKIPLLWTFITLHWLSFCRFTMGWKKRQMPTYWMSFII